MPIVTTPYIFGAGAPPVAEGHRYWRLYASTVNSGTQWAIQELQMFDVVGGTDLCVPSTVIWASSTYESNPTYGPSKAVDGTYEGGPSGFWSANDAAPQWIAVDFETAKDIKQFKVYPVDTGAANATAAAELSIQWSDNGTDWYTQQSWTGMETGWVAGTAKTFNVAAEGVDPYLANVSLHLHTDTTELGYDSSPNTKPPGTVFGTLTRTTTEQKFGASAAKTGAPGYLVFAAHSDFAMPGDFTVEMQVKLTTYGLANQGLFNIGAYNTGMMFRVASGSVFEVWILGTPYTFLHSLPLNALHEIQVNRSKGKLRVLANGNPMGAAQNCTTSPIPAGAITVATMAHSPGSEYLSNGVFDEVRVTKGVARKIEKYLPSTAAFPDDPGSLIPIAIPDSQWRISVAANNGGDAYVSLWEVQLLDAGGTNLLNSSMPVASSSSYPGNEAPKALDGNLSGPSAGWLNNGGTVAGQWWMVDAGATLAPVTLKIAPQNSTRAPKDFTLQKLVGSTWTDVKVFAGITTWTAETFQSFTL